jgi:hypothetical protein
MPQGVKDRIIKKMKDKFGASIPDQLQPNPQPTTQPNPGLGSLQPLYDNAVKNMTPDQLNKYEEMGKAYFEDLDMESSSVNQITSPTDDFLAYMKHALKSGLHPFHMDEDEKTFMKDVVGEKWYEQYGFEENDLTGIHIN